MTTSAHAPWAPSASFASRPQTRWLRRGLENSKSLKMVETTTESGGESRGLVACYWLPLNLQAYNSAQHKVDTK